LPINGIISKFDFVPSQKISPVMPVYRYNFKVTSESHDILANYVASSVQWHKCYGTLRPRGNAKKPKTPDEMTVEEGLCDSSLSGDESIISYSERTLRCQVNPQTKQEKHHMEFQGEPDYVKRSKGESFEDENFDFGYDSNLE
jgi:hypothetical protein